MLEKLKNKIGLGKGWHEEKNLLTGKAEEHSKVRLRNREMEFSKCAITPIMSIEEIGEAIGIDWRKIDKKEFKMGMEVELEHGKKFGRMTNVTNNDPIMTGRIVLAHLIEIRDYYTRLKQMEEEAKKELGLKD